MYKRVTLLVQRSSTIAKPFKRITFRSISVADASASYSWVKDTSSWVGVPQVSADRFQIELDPRRIINAVVLSGAVSVRQSELYMSLIGYLFWKG